MTKNNTYTVEGVVTEIAPVRAAGQSTARDFVVRTTEDYPQLLRFEVYGKTVPILDNVSVDAEVAVSFNIRGREWNGKVINNNSAFKIDALVSSEKPAATPKKASPSKAPEAAPAQTSSTDEPVF